MREIPLSQRSTLRDLFSKVGESLGTMHRVLKEGVVKRVSSTLKPDLQDENKKTRLNYALNMLSGSSNEFKETLDYIHVDEKWFYLTKVKTNFYVAPDEEIPVRSCRSKNFLIKVMFLAAVARPWYDPHRKADFNGKIGIWPFVVQEPGKRNSKNRQRGTLVTKPVEVTREVYVRTITEKLIPAIKEKWPRGSKTMPIKIQQDNARPHCSVDDEEVVRAGPENGWNIKMICQPPNSPDFNVLDLDFFNAIQSLQHKESRTNIDDMAVGWRN